MLFRSALNEGAKLGLGAGEALGKWIVEHNFPYAQYSVLAACYKLHVPATVHIGIGCDIVHEQPEADGAALGAASTLWVLFDLEKRCMVAPGEVAKAIPDNSDLTPPLGVPGPVPRLTGAETCSARTPVYSELDVNGHVNNARYADWLCDALGLEVMREYRVKTMRLSYAAEIRPGQAMELRLTRDGLAYHLTGAHEGKTHFEIGGELEKRL